MSSLETDGRSLYYNLIHQTADGFAQIDPLSHMGQVCALMYSHRLIVKSPIGGDFFYGKSSNENHT